MFDPFVFDVSNLQIIFALNFLAGFCLVCIILPIDLLVMSFMRYIRFQFHVIADDLVSAPKENIKYTEQNCKLTEGFN